ncbi:MAG: hypothetical protein LBF89_07125 [Bacteroidales bacterium]|jgi:hypothetical protein|nr:hypothetical protein [Bacteroidales bacterium]
MKNRKLKIHHFRDAGIFHRVAMPVLVCLWMCGECVPLRGQENRHANVLYGVAGTYATPPRNADGTVNMTKLLKELKDIHANTYHWLIRDNNDELDVLKQFLPRARRKHINVWVTIVPPSEQPPVLKAGYAEPYRLDFEKWAKELAGLSLTEPNLVAWSIDDFAHNLKTFTPQYMEKIIKASKEVNPEFLFVPCCYYAQVTDNFIRNYIRFCDGILFPYRAESEKANLQNPHLVEQEISRLREKTGIPVILDIYASAHSKLGASTAEYVEKVLHAGLATADGVLIYTHLDAVQNAAKHAVIKKGFRRYKPKNNH